MCIHVNSYTKIDFKKITSQVHCIIVVVAVCQLANDIARNYRQAYYTHTIIFYLYTCVFT